MKSAEEIRVMVELYLEHNSSEKVADVLGVSSSCVLRNLQKNYPHIINYNSYKLNHAFFNKPTPESFYWAGFITADGNISKNTLDICLSNKDRNHLEKFISAACYSGQIKDKKPNACRVSIISQQWKKDLERFGIVPAKTKIYDVPDWVLDNSLVNHFLRGYFDGDGCIGIYNRRFEFSLSGTKIFLSKYMGTLVKYCKVNRIKVKPSSGIFSIGYCGNKQVKRIVNWIYKDSYEGIELGRKKIIAFSDPKSVTIKKKIVGYSIDTGERLEFPSIASTATMGFAPAGVSGCCRGIKKTHKGYRWEYLNEKSN